MNNRQKLRTEFKWYLASNNYWRSKTNIIVAIGTGRISRVFLYIYLSLMMVHHDSYDCCLWLYASRSLVRIRVTVAVSYWDVRKHPFIRNGSRPLLADHSQTKIFYELVNFHFLGYSTINIFKVRLGLCLKNAPNVWVFIFL